MLCLCGWLSPTSADVFKPGEPGAAPWHGPRSAFIFIEAEDMQTTGGWSVDNDIGRRVTTTSSNYKSLSGASAEAGVATANFEVPADGQYRCWVRYARFRRPTAKDRAPFKLILKQNNNVLAHQAIDATYDGPMPPNGGPGSPYPIYEWVAQSVTLKQGVASLTFEKTQGSSVNAGVRKIDCVLITADLEHEPDFRDFGPQSYLRFRVESVEPGPVYFGIFLNHMRAPFYRRAVADREGFHLNSTRSTTARSLAQGESTPWLNVSRMLDTGWDTNIAITATNGMQGFTTLYPKRSACAIDFASKPESAAILKTLNRDGPGYGLVFRVGTTITKDQLPTSDFEFATKTADMVAKLPPVNFGRRPTQFPVMTEWSASDRTHTPGTRDLELKVMHYLGINANATGPLEPNDIENGVLFSRTFTQVWYQGKGGYNDPNTPRITSSIKNKSAEFLSDPLHDRYIYTKIGDESTATPLVRLASNPINQAAFKKWLQENNRTPEQLGVASWDQVKIITGSNTNARALYVASQQFRAHSIANFYHQATALIHEHYGEHVKTTQNFSDGAVYLANMYAQGNDYFTWFKNKSLDIAVSEDWTALGSTPQCCGWNVALLRSATKYHKQPIGMYVISYGPGIDTKLRAYSDMAQGAKSLNFYAYGPLYQGHEPGWSKRPETYWAIAQVNHEIGAAEHILIDAMPTPAATAIIYSVASDIWDISKDNATGHERMHAYIAMRHGQVAVDILSEEDVIEGRLAQYKTAYVYGDNLNRAAVTPLSNWVNAGGTLVLGAGAAEKDELNQPMRDLDQTLGLSRQPVQRMQNLWTSGRNIDTLLKSNGHVTFINNNTKTSVDLLARRQNFTVNSSSKVLATFDDGSPASVMQPAGQGQVYMNGFMPALAYIAGALRADKAKVNATSAGNAVAANLQGEMDLVTSMQIESQRLSDISESVAPDQFDAALREFILAPAMASGDAQPVKTNTPLVEATLMQGEKGWVVLLANYTGKPIQNLQVTINARERLMSKIQSSRQGELQAVRVDAGTYRIELPLDSTDMVYASWND